VVADEAIVILGSGMSGGVAATTSRPEAHKFGTVGKALGGVELKVAEDGELLVKGPNIFAGRRDARGMACQPRRVV